jgi:hypothetical protein
MVFLKSGRTFVDKYVDEFLCGHARALPRQDSATAQPAIFLYIHFVINRL